MVDRMPAMPPDAHCTAACTATCFLYRRVADYVVLNKVDMMNEATMASLEAIIASLNPLAKVGLMLVGLFWLVCLASWCSCVYKCWCE